MKILKYLLIAIVVFSVFSQFRRLSGKDVVTAQDVAAEANKRIQFPVDLGDGFSLDSVTASGNAVVSTVTVSGMPPGPLSEPVRQALEAASVSDTCRELEPASRKAYVDAGLTMVKTYKDPTGAQLLSVTIHPGQCP